ncbi:hypothetical protein WR25_13735 [Diploscapter pachys]|uniref:NR LBD domain-containing protein n=1 Tax=Diploscapter pachys TaxID=2018661 RepID=A0A2A2J694_9BILA|nr:hypothetical protein WR25_13735 [Diploscapter pachys]
MESETMTMRGIKEEEEDYMDYEDEEDAIGMNPDQVQHERDRNMKDRGNNSCGKLTQLRQIKKVHKATLQIATQTDESLNSSPLPLTRYEQPDSAKGSPDSNDLPTPRDFLTIPQMLLDLDNLLMDNTSSTSSDLYLNSGFKAQVVFRRPLLLCSRTPITFKTDHLINIDEWLTEWKRHFILYSDWCHALEDFRLFSDSDQANLAQRRLHHLGWLFFGYQSYKAGVDGFAFTAGGYHPVEGGDEKITEIFKTAMPYYRSQLLSGFKRVQITDYEYVMLKVLTLFAEDTGISCEGKRLLKKTRDKYIVAFFQFLKYARVRYSTIHSLFNFVILVQRQYRRCNGDAQPVSASPQHYHGRNSLDERRRAVYGPVQLHREHGRHHQEHSHPKHVQIALSHEHMKRGPSNRSW